MPDQAVIVARIIDSAPRCIRLLRVLAGLRLPDAWIAAGAIRNTVWDTLHGYPHPTPLNDVDVIWFDPDRADPAEDRRLEARLAARRPDEAWSVKNQARMHIRHGHAPYADSLDAMRAWPETATAVAARLTQDGTVEVQAAHDFDDLLGLILRPVPGCPDRVFRERLAARSWLRLWPRLQIADAG